MGTDSSTWCCQEPFWALLSEAPAPQQSRENKAGLTGGALTGVASFRRCRISSGPFLAPTRQLHRLRFHRRTTEKIAKQRAGAFTRLRPGELDFDDQILAVSARRNWLQHKPFDGGVPFADGRQKFGFGSYWNIHNGRRKAAEEGAVDR